MFTVLFKATFNHSDSAPTHEENTLYHFHSITKPFEGAALLF